MSRIRARDGGRCSRPSPRTCPPPFVALSLLMRFRSRQADSFGAKAIAALRNEFGGHANTPSALGGVLSRRDWHVNWSAGHFKVDGFSTPFFAAALLGLLTLLAALRWLRRATGWRVARHPECRQQSRSIARTTSGWRAVHLADECAVSTERSSAHRGRSGCRVDGDWPRAESPG